jgi:hypothetical protein
MVWRGDAYERQDVLRSAQRVGVLVIDTSTNPAMAIRTDFDFGALTGDLKWSGACLAPNGKTY